VDSQPPGCRLTLAYVAAWLVSSAFLIIDVLLVREALLSVLTWVSAQQGKAPSAYSAIGWTIEFVDRALVLILACVGVALSVVLEHYYRRGAENGLLIRRTTRGLGALLAVGLAAWLLQVLF
jgi:hypothetical protein